MPEGLFSSISDIASQARDKFSGLYGSDPNQNSTIVKVLDPSGVGNRLAKLRQQNVGPGGALASSGAGSSPNVSFSDSGSDWRVKISLANNADYFYKDTNNKLLMPLVGTGGVIFPYTPQISMSHTARYGATSLTHSNYTNYFYEGSEVAAINITGEFTVQNIDEGNYLLAVIYFFRAATKMFFGQGAKVGSPPPMVFLNGYGSHYFPNVSCVVTSFQHTMSQEVDYISIPTGGGAANTARYYENDGSSSTTNTAFTRVPTISTITVTLQPIYTRKNLAKNFDLNKFSAGELLKGKGGFV